MKKSVVLTLLGLGVVAATTAYGQGGISIGNYTAPFNPVVWGPSTPVAGTAVKSTDGVNLTLWFGQQGSALNNSVAIPWNTDAEANGYAGYYGPVTAVLPGFASGQTWSFQVVASGTTAYGNAVGASQMWTESANIADITPSTPGGPPGTPGISTGSYSLIVDVPEPTILALGAMGLAGLLAFRRRS
jgi:MYXO-CTERM domain-containing protein